MWVASRLAFNDKIRGKEKISLHNGKEEKNAKNAGN
jgi:hypothetical protein